MDDFEKEMEAQLEFLSDKEAIQKKLNELKREEVLIQQKILTASETEKKHLEKRLENIRRYYKLLKNQSKELGEIVEEEKTAWQLIIEQNEELNKQYKKYNNIKDTLNEMKDCLAPISSTMKSIVSYEAEVNGLDLSKLNPKEAHKTIVAMERSAAKLGMRAGQGEQGVKNLTSAFKDLQRETGASAEDAREIVETLSETGYVENIKEASVSISLFGRATGVANGQTIEMMNSLTKVGKFSNKEASNVLANITKVQQKNGITRAGMTALTNGIAKATTNMKAFGQSEQAIKNMTMETAKLVSGMEKVGVSAETALGWIDKLTDPERIEENIGLYAQLGMSISDALSGNLDTSAIGEGMKEFGQKVKDMGPIAGKEYAKAFGVSYKEAIKAAEFEGPQVEEVEVDKNLEALTAMKEATLDASAAMQENINKLSGELQSMNKSLLRGFNGLKITLLMIFSAIMRNINNEADTVSRGFKKHIKEDINEISQKVTDLYEQAEGEYKLEEQRLDKKIEEARKLLSSGNLSEKDATKVTKKIQSATYQKEANLSELNKKKGLIDKEAQKELNRLRSELKEFPGKMSRQGKDALREFDKGAESIKNAGKQSATSISSGMNRASTKTKTKISQAYNQGSRTTSKALNSGFSEGAAKIRAAAASIKTGGSGAGGKAGLIIGIITSAVYTLTGLLNSWFPKIGEWFGKNKWLKPLGDMLGFDTTLKDGLEKNTETLLEGEAKLENNNGPEQIFRQDNGRTAVKTTGDIINSNNANTTNTSTTTTTTTTTNTSSAAKQQNTNLNELIRQGQLISDKHEQEIYYLKLIAERGSVNVTNIGQKSVVNNTPVAVEQKADFANSNDSGDPTQQ